MFGEPLKDVIIILDNMVNFEIGDKGPMKLIEKSDEAEYIFFIAPKSEDE